MKITLLELSVFFLAACSCGENDKNEINTDPVADGPSATVYTTSVSGKRFEKSSITLGKPEEVHTNLTTLSGESFHRADMLRGSLGRIFGHGHIF